MTWLAAAVKAFWQLLPVYDAVARRASKPKATPAPAPKPKLGNQRLSPEDERAKYAGWRH